jgi:hypothetical protein
MVSTPGNITNEGAITMANDKATVENLTTVRMHLDPHQLHAADVIVDMFHAPSGSQDRLQFGS